MWENPIITDTKNLAWNKKRKVAVHNYNDLSYKQKLTVRIPRKNCFYVQVVAPEGQFSQAPDFSRKWLTANRHQSKEYKLKISNFSS